MKNADAIDFKRIAAAVAGVVVLAPLLLAAVLWATRLAPGIQARMARKAAIAPLVKQARKLRLAYDSVLADPRGSVGKPALWCLRRAPAQGGYKPLPGSTAAAAAKAAPTPVTAFAETYYDGVQGRSVYIDNPEKMYPMYGSSHQSCVKTLVTIKKVEAHDFGGGPRYRLEAEFVEYP